MQVIIVIILQLLLCAACSAGALAWRETVGACSLYPAPHLTLSPQLPAVSVAGAKEGGGGGG